MNTIGQRIKHLREIKGMTQKELADAINSTRDSVAGWEINRTAPPLEAIIAMAVYFGVPSDFILGISNNVVMEVGILYGLSPPAMERVAKYADFERSTQELPDDDRGGSSGLTSSDKNGNKIQFKKGTKKKRGTA